MVPETVRPVPGPTRVPVLKARLGANELSLAELCPASSATARFPTGCLHWYSSRLLPSRQFSPTSSDPASSQCTVAGYGPLACSTNSRSSFQIHGLRCWTSAFLQVLCQLGSVALHLKYSAISAKLLHQILPCSQVGTPTELL